MRKKLSEMQVIPAIFVILTSLLMSCGKNEESPPAKPLILVSAAPYQLFAERIGGEHIDVRSIVPQDADLHAFEPTPQQRGFLQQMRIWFCIGEPFESKLIGLLASQGKIIDLSQNIELLSSSCCQACETDRHMWMSPRTVRYQAGIMAGILIKEFPSQQKEFERNLHLLYDDLDMLDAEIRQLLVDVQMTALLASHPAFGYFCRDYSLSQLSIEFEGKELRMKQFIQLIDQTEQCRRVIAIALPQHSNKGVQRIADELNIPIKTINPYSHDYFNMMRDLARWTAYNQ
jgi:zinc transport system substrate-binding protein